LLGFTHMRSGWSEKTTHSGRRRGGQNKSKICFNQPIPCPLSFSHLKRKAIIHTQTNARTGEEEKIRRNGFLLKISKKKSCYFDTTIQSSFLSCWKLGNESVLLYF
jgi:hypothetical protein